MKKIKNIIRYLIRLHKFLKGKKDSVYTKEFWLWTIGVIIGFFIICFLPLWLSKWSVISFPDGANVIGDTLGGIMGPFVAMLAAFLTFIAFWIQYKANEQQREQFKVQSKQFEIQSDQLKTQDHEQRVDRFESRFFELIKIHRENVTEITLSGKINGRQSFTAIYKEFVFCYDLILLFLNSKYSTLNEKLSILKIEKPSDLTTIRHEDINEKATILAYLIVYFGINKDNATSSKFKEQLSKSYELAFINDLFEQLTNISISWDVNRQMMIYSGLTPTWLKDNPKKYTSSYLPFKGHHSFLGHYFRHLYQTVHFVIDQPSDFLNNDKKYSYIKTLRSQISDFEMVMLYYNSITDMGKKWHTEYLFRDWLIIKNIPQEYVSFGVKMEVRYPEDNRNSLLFNRNMFGWD